MSHRIARLTISEHKRLKVAASLMDISMKQLVIMSIDDFMQKKINKVTERAVKQSKSGKNLKKFDTLDELFKDLSI